MFVFLVRQALPLCGDGDEMDNFTQLLKLRGEDDPRVFAWIKRKTDKYTPGKMQNKRIKVMSLKILRNVASALQNTAYYTIMIDETTDVSNEEQVVVYFRWVSDDFEVRKDFLGMYAVDSIDAKSLLGVVHDVLKQLNLSKACQKLEVSAMMVHKPCLVD